MSSESKKDTGLGILDLLTLRGFDRRQPAKLVRHMDNRYDVYDLYRRGWLGAYQSFQRRSVFDNCDRIVSFLGMEGNRAKFVGVYRVLGHMSGDKGTLPPGCPYTEWLDNRDRYYELEPESGYEDLENRVIIDWGPFLPTWSETHGCV